MAVAFFAGSCDPGTWGHHDIVHRGLCVFDQVVVGVGHNPAKRSWVPAERRVELFADAIGTRPAGGGVSVSDDMAARVRFVVFEGLAVAAARAEGAQVLLRGLRGAADLDLEQRNATANRELAGIDTLWLPTAPEWGHVSSSLVREIATFGGDVRRYVPPGVARAIADREATSSRS